MGDRILIVAAHPDDEVLGVGGAAARHADAGDEVHVLILAEGATARGTQRDVGVHGAEIDRLRKAANAAAAILGTLPPRFGGLPDNRMDSLDLLDVVKVVEAVVDEVRPAAVYTHHGADLNIDHRVTALAVRTACRPLPGQAVANLYAFETLSSTEWGESFEPVRFVGIETTLERKLRALECYSGEMRPFPHARSLQAVEALARLRGAQNGLAAAEGFAVLRQVRG